MKVEENLYSDENSVTCPVGFELLNLLSADVKMVVQDVVLCYILVMVCLILKFVAQYEFINKKLQMDFSQTIIIYHATINQWIRTM